MDKERCIIETVGKTERKLVEGERCSRRGGEILGDGSMKGERERETESLREGEGEGDTHEVMKIVEERGGIQIIHICIQTPEHKHTLDMNILLMRMHRIILRYIDLS